MQDPKKPEGGERTIYVNNEPIHVKEDSLTAKQILEMAKLDPDRHDLFEVQGQDSNRLKTEQSVEIKDELYFNAILKSVTYGDTRETAK